jgi:GR25 family glycosyltransferase involved in LPS biosynthesis
MCVSLKESIIVLEHDAKIVRKWDNFSWKDVLHLDHEGSVKRKHYAQGKDISAPVVENSVYSMAYKAFDQPWTSSMNCAYAYAIQPDAAQRLIDLATSEGWYAADRFIQEPVVDIDTIHPKVAEEQPEALTISTTWL